MTIVQSIRDIRSVPVETAPRTAATTPDVDFGAVLAKTGELPEAAAPMPRGSRTGELDPLQKFEGFVLRTFVESMLPKNATAVFGEGTAGDIWRSMMAERIGEEIAAAGGIGIADMLAKDNASKVAAGADALAEAQAKMAGTNAAVR